MSDPARTAAVFPPAPLRGALDWPGPPLGLHSTITSARVRAPIVSSEHAARVAGTSPGVGRVHLVRLFGHTVALRSASAHLETLARDLLPRGVGPVRAEIEVVSGDPPRIELTGAQLAIAERAEFAGSANTHANHGAGGGLESGGAAGPEAASEAGPAADRDAAGELPLLRLVGTSRWGDLLRGARALLEPDARNAVIADAGHGSVLAWCTDEELPGLAGAALASGARVHAAGAIVVRSGRFLRDAPAVLLPVGLAEMLPVLVPRFLRARFENVGDSSTSLVRALGPRLERLVATLLHLPDPAAREVTGQLEMRALEDVAARLLGSEDGVAIVALEADPGMIPAPLTLLEHPSPAELLEALR